MTFHSPALAASLLGGTHLAHRRSRFVRAGHRVCGDHKQRRPARIALRRAAVMAALPGLPPLPAALAAAGGGGALGTLVLGGLLLAALLALTGRRGGGRGDLGRLPGPKQLPLLGNLADLGHPQAHQTIAEWADRFGSLVRFKLLQDSVLVTDPVEVEGVLSRRGAEELPKPAFIYAPLDPIYSSESIPSFFTTPDKAVWAAVRKGCAPAFSPDNMRRAFPVVRDTVGAVCDQLAVRLAASRAAAADSAAKSAAEEGEDMQEAALRVALDSFALTALQHDFGARHYGRCEVLQMLPPLLAEFSRRALNPLRAVFHALAPWTEDAVAFRRNLRAAHALWAHLATEVRATDVAAAEAAGDSSLRVCLAKLKDPATGLPLSQAQLAPHVAAFLVAGFETTGHSVAWALYEVARSPEVQARLAAELATAGLVWAPGRPGRPLELQDLSALPYLDQVWREALRLHPVASVGPIRTTDREVQLRSGAKVPKGTALWMSTIALHTSSNNFTDPLRFWPERWQQQPGAGEDSAAGGAAAVAATAAAPAAAAATAEEQQQRGSGCPFASVGRPTPSGNSASPQRSFMPYSYGPRDCLGQALANMEGKAMIAALVSRFSFRVAPRMGGPAEVRAAEVNRLTLQSGKGVWLLLEPRGT